MFELTSVTISCALKRTLESRMARELEENADHRFNFRESIFQDISVKDEVELNIDRFGPRSNIYVRKFLMQGQPSQSCQVIREEGGSGKTHHIKHGLIHTC